MNVNISNLNKESSVVDMNINFTTSAVDINVNMENTFNLIASDKISAFAKCYLCICNNDNACHQSCFFLKMKIREQV